MRRVEQRLNSGRSFFEIGEPVSGGVIAGIDRS
jgi:hypothetical protein